MRVLLVTPMLGPGGIERAVQNCAAEYTRRGIKAAVLSYREGGARVEPIRQAGSEVFLPTAGFDAAVRDAAHWKPDILHLHRAGMWEAAWGPILKAIARADAVDRLPVVETNHFARVDASPDHLAIDVHMHLSRWCLWKWRNWSRGQTPRPVGVVVPHIVRSEPFWREPPDAIAAYRRSLGIPADAIVFGRVGQPSAVKWSPIIFPAFERVAARRSDAWLLLVGLPPELRPALDALPGSARSRVALVEFAHGDDALRQCYSAMDVFLHASSIGESFGYVLCESMLCRTPVITLARPLKDNSQPEVVGHRRGGLVVCDARSITEAMHMLIEDAALRRSLGEQGRAWVLEHCSPQAVGDQLIRVLNAAVSSRGDGAGLQSALADLAPPVARSDIRRLLHDCLGRPSLRDRAMLPLVNDARLYRLWRRLKFRGAPL